MTETHWKKSYNQKALHRLYKAGITLNTLHADIQTTALLALIHVASPARDRECEECEQLFGWWPLDD